MIGDVSDLVRAEYGRIVEKIAEIMVASTSHEMRTPLNTIISMHKMIESKTQDEKLLKWLKIATHSTNLLQFLVNDTLDYF